MVRVCNSPHWIWLIAALGLFVIGMSFSAYSLYLSLHTAALAPETKTQNLK